MSLYGEGGATPVARKLLKAPKKETNRQARISSDIVRCQRLVLNYMAQQCVLRYLTEFTVSDGDNLITYQRRDLKAGATRWVNEADNSDRFVIPDPTPPR